MRKLIYAINLRRMAAATTPSNLRMKNIVGEGRRLMEGVSLPERLQLKLAESKIFKSGCVALRYLKP